MPVVIQQTRHAVVLTLKGKFLGSLHGPALIRHIESCKGRGQLQVVVDLSLTELMDSAGVGVLIGALTSMRNVGGDVRLGGMNSRIRHLFSITKLLGTVFTAYDTVPEAVASYSQAAPEPAA
ncbi:MAG: STAS domain-containing protein [Bacteroidota bacterium]